MGNSKNDSVADGDNSGGDVPDSDTAIYSEGEKVLAYHGPRIYEAKVQKAEVRKKEWRYFVHYLGWNKNWDEWVGADRLMKHSQENVNKQQALEKKQAADKNSKSASRAPQSKSKSSTDVKTEKEDIKNTVSKGKKRKADSIIEDIDASVEKVVKIQIPSSLKKQLVEDCKFIQQDKLVKLPRSPTVDDILTKYLEYRTKNDGTITDSVGEILNGLRCYFDKSLEIILLYKNERQQYNEAVVAANSVSPSTVYGAEHLLRLFVKLPELLSYVSIEEEALSQLQLQLVDLLK
ncbi:protein MRG1-like isoform X1 [Impatiens glandulifera]|uniref:protein MRG1-like isoform X1 n=1 Tax=Impatiens glandulifera TaxID=253017 RepID=UPI001FB0FA5E|nr:protein MRG1-like isoform X1 [Impatiens glandulifera]